MKPVIYITERLSREFTAIIVGRGYVKGLYDVAHRFDLYWEILEGRQFIGIHLDKDYYFNMVRLLYYLATHLGCCVLIRPGAGKSFSRIECADDYQAYVEKYFLLNLSKSEKAEFTSKFEDMLSVWKRKELTDGK